MIRPPNIPPTTPAVPVRSTQATDHGNQQPQNHDRPGSHKGFMFRYSGGPSPRPRPPQRNAPTRRKAIQANQDAGSESYEKETDEERNDRLNQLSTEVSSGDSDQHTSSDTSADADQRREERRLLALHFRALTKPESDAAAQVDQLAAAAAAAPSPLVGQGPALYQQFTQRALKAIDRIEQGAVPGTIRSALFADVLSLIAMSASANLPAGGLAAVREHLIDASREMQRVSGKSELIKDLNCLLPMLLLNLQRPRTELQASLAMAKLTVMAQRGSPLVPVAVRPVTPPEA
jgi:hypothetical protein